MTLDEISDLVKGPIAPYTSDRCTVYMERDLNLFLSEGWQRSQIMAAVFYSVRDNYLSKVVGKSVPGKKIYFQGVTARNKALVAVFENELNQPVFVSKLCHLTGALGLHLDLSIEEISQAFLGGQKRYEDKKQIWASQGVSILKNNGDKIKILLLGRPYALFDPRINQLHKTLFEVSGFESHVMPLDREVLNQGYRYATGGECLPNVAIVGSLIACLENKQIPPEKAVLYLPGICMSCNFNQYADLVKLACQKGGL